MTLSFKLFATGAIAIALAACTPPAGKQAEAPEVLQADPTFRDGTVRASLNGGAEVEMAASECMIVSEGGNGVVRAGEGSFELNWSDTGSRAVWSSDAGLYNGDVQADLAGSTVTFQGAADGATISGSATCSG
ncbi:MAG: hypothetical protein AB7P07_05515 [Hyphomonadaceae bacterium]